MLHKKHNSRLTHTAKCRASQRHDDATRTRRHISTVCLSACVSGFVCALVGGSGVVGRTGIISYRQTSRESQQQMSTSTFDDATQIQLRMNARAHELRLIYTYVLPSTHDHTYIHTVCAYVPTLCVCVGTHKCVLCERAAVRDDASRSTHSISFVLTVVAIGSFLSLVPFIFEHARPRVSRASHKTRRVHSNWRTSYSF